jgi:hypothetical protein
LTFADALQHVLAAEGVRDIRMDIPGRGTVDVPLEVAAAPDGLMPAFLAAGDAVMRAATGGRGFAPCLEADPGAVLGWRVADPGASRALALLCAQDAIKQITRGGGLAADDLMRVWRDAGAVADFGKAATPAHPGPSP